MPVLSSNDVESITDSEYDDWVKIVASHKKLFMLLLSLLMVGCIPNIKEEQLQKQANLENMEPCPDTRPLSCKDDKKPVCGVFSDGSTFDYDSACIACTRSVIVGYLPGKCK